MKPENSKPERWIPWAVLLLVVLCCGAFGGALKGGFVDFDDDTYVFRNAALARGWTPEAIRWAFTTGHASNWHPLTWLSHLADVSLFGLEPAGHHAVNVWLHALNAALLFGVLRRLTGRSALAWWVAALWCVHPLRVESVAWIAERKELLAATFGLLTLGVYAQGRGLAGRRRQALAAVCFALSLMAKPTWVTLPFLLLVLDHGPLFRWSPGAAAGLWREKAVLFALAAVSCAVTYRVQQAGGAVGSLDLLPPGMRLANAVVACAEYVRLLFWPSGLAVLYPYPQAGHPAGQVLIAVGALLAISVLALVERRRCPWLLAGWLWFLGTLVPMIGLVQVGRQSWADRYTYLPHIGLILAGGAVVAWGLRVLRKRQARADLLWPGLGFAGGALVLVGLVGLSRQQPKIWRNTESLFRRALAVTENNLLAHGNLGVFYGRQGQWESAIHHLECVLQQRPLDGGARYALGNVYLAQGLPAAAVEQYRLAARDSRQWRAMNDLAWLLSTGPDAATQATEALQWAERAWPLAPAEEQADLFDTLAVARANAGDFAGAIQAASQALAEGRARGRTETWRVEVQKRLDGFRQGRPWHP